jgi:hypothetical protein
MAESSGFIYGNFRPFVDNQIKTRQNMLSLENRGPENLLFLTGKTSWIKMTSSVNVTDENYLSKKYPLLLGDGLAKQFQLMGGTLWRDGKKDSLRDKMGVSSNLNNSLNYGLGGYNEVGFAPMPGILNVMITSKNFIGSLREATVTFRCNSLVQLEILEALYLRLGYQVLLEWGNTIYYTGNDKGENVKFNTGKDISYIDFFQTGITQKDVLTQIDLKKRDSQGNYDGMLGVVKNFTWRAEANGTYLCTVNLISWGEIVESLKVNSSSPNEKIGASVSNNVRSDLDMVLAYFLDPTTSDQNIVGIAKKLTIIQNYTYYDIGPNDDIGTYKTLNENEIKILNKIYERPFVTDRKEYKFKYVSLATLLNVLRNLCLISNKKGDPILNINIAAENSFALSNEYQLSVDPGVCLLPSLVFPDGKDKSRDKLYGDYAVAPYNPRIEQNLINPLKIAVNVECIKKLLNKHTDSETGEVYLLNFILSILEEINAACGYINSYDVLIDHNSNTLSIIDLQVLPLRLNPPSTIIVSQDAKKIKSFVRQYSFSSRITNQLATVIAISAQANAKNINNANVSLSRLNRGLVDRITSEKVLFSQNLDSNNPYSKIYSLKDYINLFLIIPETPVYVTDEVENMKNVAREMLSSILNLQESVSPFIPIDINLTLDGISGIRIGECFLIEENKLPRSYKKLDGNPIIKFMVRTIGHKIENNVWTTEITGLSVEYNPNLIDRTNTVPSPIIPDGEDDKDKDKNNSTGSLVGGALPTSSVYIPPVGLEIQQPDATQAIIKKPTDWGKPFGGGSSGGGGAGGSFK